MILISVKAQPKDYPTILDLWERSVIATHNFLKEEDRIALKSEIPNYFDQVEVLLWYKNEDLVGFSGIGDQSLEMLFIDPAYFRNGYGSEIINYLVEERNIKYVDVNKENFQALNFYRNHGFEVYAESAMDDQGRPYPILKLRIKN